jgi:hypothetical protein
MLHICDIKVCRVHTHTRSAQRWQDGDIGGGHNRPLIFVEAVGACVERLKELRVFLEYTRH